MKTNRILTLIIGVIAGSALVACNAPSQNAEPTTAATAPTKAAPSPTTATQSAPTAAATAATPLAGAPKDILHNAFFVKLNAAGPYRIKETYTFTVSGQTQTLEMMREFVPPGRVRMVSKPALVFPEIIVIDDVWYTKDANGTWSKSAEPQNPASNTPNIAEFLSKTISDVQLVGPEVLNGTPTMVYSMKFNAAEAGWTGTIKAWIGVADGLPYQTDLQATVSASGTQGQVQARAIYEYDPSIKINPPIP